MLLGLKINGQSERDIWYFGQQAGIKFDDGNVESINDNSLERNVFFGIIEGPDNIICVTDSDGNLLFYSDGRRFKNRFHDNLQNSPTNEYAVNYSQTAVARDPSNENRFYVFVTIQDGLKSKLTYTLVDMSLNNGLGALLPSQTNVVLTTDVGQQLLTARHANGRNTWLICLSKGVYFSFLVTEDGVSTSPVTSEEGVNFFDGSNANYGMMSISPNNETIASIFPALGELHVLSFDTLTGRLDLIYEDEIEQIITSPPFGSSSTSGAEFSDNSNILYTIHGNSGIQQYNLSDLDNIPDKIGIKENQSFSSVKRGPNKKIYVAKINDYFLGAINAPDIVGPDCDFENNVISIDAENLLDLPVFLGAKYPEGISYINICEAEETQINFSGKFREITRIEWDLGDGNTATGENILYTYSSPGTYTVTANVIDEENGNVIFTDTEEIVIYSLPSLSDLDDIYFCTENTTLFLNNYNEDILNGEDNTIFNVRYYLSENDAQLRSNEITEIVPEIGTTPIWVRVENKLSPSCFTILNFNIIVPEYITIDIPTEQYICDTRLGLTLEAPDGFSSYAWSNGANTQTTTVFNTGRYTLYVEKDFGSFICDAQITIVVLEGDELPVIEDIKVIDWSQNHNSIEVILNRRGIYEFSVDGINYQESPVFLNLPINDYCVYVRDSRCLKEIKSDTLFLLYYNKFFTPNGDGVNDYWQVINASREENIDIAIFDRFGKLLSKLKYYDRGWDGTFNGAKMPNSDYWFRVVRENGDVRYGHFTLKR
ncbi:MAG: PKD domain-containing protein [Winogradskyella sp.]|nr:MAG: PKD domain-containing protein [Winogradskyella sp.]